MRSFVEPEYIIGDTCDLWMSLHDRISQSLVRVEGVVFTARELCRIDTAPVITAPAHVLHMLIACDPDADDTAWQRASDAVAHFVNILCAFRVDRCRASRVRADWIAHACFSAALSRRQGGGRMTPHNISGVVAAIKSRWTTMESQILGDAASVSEYIYAVSRHTSPMTGRSRWIEFEQWVEANYSTDTISDSNISLSQQSTRDYVSMWLSSGQRWPFIERGLLKLISSGIPSYAGVATKYAETVMCTRWPEFEAELLHRTTPVYPHTRYADSYESYTKHYVNKMAAILQGDRWTELEQAMLSDPIGYISVACVYAQVVMNGYWQDFERSLALAGKRASYYYPFVTLQQTAPQDDASCITEPSEAETIGRMMVEYAHLVQHRVLQFEPHLLTLEADSSAFEYYLDHWPTGKPWKALECMFAQGVSPIRIVRDYSRKIGDPVSFVDFFDEVYGGQLMRHMDYDDWLHHYESSERE